MMILVRLMLLWQCRLCRFLSFARVDVTPVEAKALLDFRSSVTCECLKSQARGSHAAPQVAFRLSDEHHPPGSAQGSRRTVCGSACIGHCSFLYQGVFLWCLILPCFLRAVCKKFGLHVSRLMLAFLVLSTGMFCSSAGKFS